MGVACSASNSLVGWDGSASKELGGRGCVCNQQNRWEGLGMQSIELSRRGLVQGVEGVGGACYKQQSWVGGASVCKQQSGMGRAWCASWVELSRA